MTVDLRFKVLFNSISVILGQCEVDNERLCTMKLRLRLRRFRPSGDRSRSTRSAGQRLTHWATGAPILWNMYLLIHSPAGPALKRIESTLIQRKTLDRHCFDDYFTLCVRWEQFYLVFVNHSVYVDPFQPSSIDTKLSFAIWVHSDPLTTLSNMEGFDGTVHMRSLVWDLPVWMYCEYRFNLNWSCYHCHHNDVRKCASVFTIS